MEYIEYLAPLLSLTDEKPRLSELEGLKQEVEQLKKRNEALQNALVDKLTAQAKKIIGRENSSQTSWEGEGITVPEG